jgi:hypothetical protein
LTIDRAGLTVYIYLLFREEMEQKLLRAEARVRPPWFRYSLIFG